MADIKVKAEMESEVLVSLEQMCTDLQTVMDEAKNISTTYWQGDAKDKFFEMRELTVKYHDSVMFLIESLKQHITVLVGDIDEFTSISTAVSNMLGVIV